MPHFFAACKLPVSQDYITRVEETHLGATRACLGGRRAGGRLLGGSLACHRLRTPVSTFPPTNNSKTYLLGRVPLACSRRLLGGCSLLRRGLLGSSSGLLRRGSLLGGCGLRRCRLCGGRLCGGGLLRRRRLRSGPLRGGGLLGRSCLGCRALRGSLRFGGSLSLGRRLRVRLVLPTRLLPTDTATESHRPCGDSPPSSKTLLRDAAS